MPNPLPGLRTKLAALRHRPWQGKDIAILVLTLLLLAVSGYAFREPLSAAFARARAGAAGGETVSVFNVVVDNENRQFVDILFDRPLGEGKVDQIIDPPPATIEPALGGSWKWKDTNALRFQPSGGFPVASEYRVDLIPERLLQEGQVFSGETEVVVRTDQFLVEGSMWSRSRLSRGRGRWCSGGRSGSTIRSIRRCSLPGAGWRTLGLRSRGR